MDAIIDDVAQQITRKFKTIPSDVRLLISVAGIPGSGKSTLAYPLADRINSLLVPTRPVPSQSTDVDPVLARAEASEEAGGGDEIALCVGLDGWHYSRAELEAFEDPVEAKRRRGAAFTFNASSYFAFIRSLRTEPFPSSIPFPTFDHALKDPTPSPHPILPHHRIVVIEGLYTLADVGDWREAAELMDVKIFVECDTSMARERVVRRNFEAGVEDTLKKTIVRVDTSDMVNGEWVKSHLLQPDILVQSLDDPKLGRVVKEVVPSEDS